MGDMMAQKIKAIETTYKGYRFRSRLEARWACFFDALGIKWEYEIEGFDLTEAAAELVASWDARDPDDIYNELNWTSPEDIDWVRQQQKIWYLPDFFLPDQNKYIEIKPYQGFNFMGKPQHFPIRQLGGWLVHGMPGSVDDKCYEVCVFWDAPYFFGYCPDCNSFDVGFLAWAERICKKGCIGGHYRKEDMTQSLRYIEAVNFARAARFEHGESPRL